MPNKVRYNSLFYTETTMMGVKEFGVTLIAAKWSKYREFSSSDDAKHCIAQLTHIQYKKPLYALEQFMRYNIKGQWRVSLSSILKQGTLIIHDTNLLDGTVSRWVATLQGDHLEPVETKVLDLQTNTWSGSVGQPSNTYASLNAFIRSHYNAVRPNRKGGNGWIECKAKVNGKWTQLSELRVTQ